MNDAIRSVASVRCPKLFAALFVAMLGVSVSVASSLSPVAAADGAATDQVDTAEEQVFTQLAAANAAAGGIGVYYDFEADLLVSVFPDDVAGAVAARAIDGHEAVARVEFRSIEQATIDAIETQLLERSFDSAAAEATYGFFFDPRSGKVVVDLVAENGAMMDALVRQFPDAVDIRSSTHGGPMSRTNDSAPHWGGAIVNSGATGCTSGYAVSKAGATYMVTAAHCFQLMSTVSGGTGLVWGGVSDRGPYPAWDVELITGNYAGAIYSGDLTGVHQAVKNGGDPVVGNTSYCLSGRSSFETCSHHAIANNGVFCVAAGCTGGLAVFTDGAPALPGDSGAPWYNYATGGGVLIRATEIGSAGPDQYAERWLSTKAHWGLTLLTS
jgi:hypothetical protein